MVLCTLAFTACTDNSYNLGDIDTTAHVNVHDLVLSAKSVNIQLDDVLDISDDSKIKKIDGIYAVKESGEIPVSKDITIPSFTALGAVATFTTPELISFSSLVKTRAGGSEPSVSAKIPTKETSISLSTKNVDAAVMSLTHVGVSVDVSIKVQFTGISTALQQLHISNLAINFVKGLDATVENGTYDSKTGVINIGDGTTVTNGSNLEYVIILHVTGINVGEDMAARFSGHEFTFDAKASVAEGATISAGFSDLKTNAAMPSSAGFLIRAEVSDIVATAFSGKVKYEVSDIAPQYVNLTDIPDMLRDSGTSIDLDNPSVKLNVTNPISEYVDLQAGLSITGHNTYSTATDAVKLWNAENIIYLMPKVPVDRPADGSEYVEFADLGKVLSGSGLPSKLRIDVLSPMAPEQEVTNFPLGKTYEGVKGTWEFYAPLSLTDKAKIRYEKEWDDWGDKDLDNLCIESAVITANVDSDVPLDMEISMVLNGKSGNMTAEKVTIAPNAKATPITINLKGYIKGVKGMKVVAGLKGGNGTLKPDQKIVLKNVSATVNGYYEEKL